MLNNNVVVKVCAQTVNGEPGAQLEAVSQKTLYILPAVLGWHLLTCNILPADLRWHLLTCNILPPDVRWHLLTCNILPPDLRWHLLTLKMVFTGRFAIAPFHLEKSFYWQSCDGIFSPWIFFPADLARHLLTCKFFHLQIWHGTFQGCQMHRKTKMIKPKFKSKLKSSKQPWNPLRPKPKYHIPSKTSKFCWKTTKWCENHQKQIRNALQPNCTTINAIIVTNTTKYGSVHRSGTLHHKPSCKNTERSQKTTKGHKRPPRIQMPPRDD